MPELLTPDLCIIGAGSGGLSVAAAAAAMGVAVVLIEKGEMGGDCLNTGCVPSKALIAAAHAAHVMRGAGRFGIMTGEPRVDFAKVRSHVQSVIAQIAPNDSQARFEAMNVRVIRAAARFTGRNQCEAGGITIKARRFVVATGSSPVVPPILGIDLVRALTSDSIFDLASLPPRLVIIGAGPIGIELAQAFRRLGSEVTILDSGAALAQEDPELAEPALVRLAREGVVLRPSVAILRIEPRGTGVRVVLAGQRLEESIDGSHLLIATGRAPNVENLGLDLAGVAFDKTGIKVGRNLRSTNKRIYAVGDVAGGLQLTHLANYQAGLVLRATLFRLRVQQQPQLVPRVTYSDPEIAGIGLSEAQARLQHRHIRILRWPFAENDRACTERDTSGLIKVITARNGQILGAGITGAGAGDMIGLWVLAISKAMKISDIAALVLPYPTRGEISRRVAITSYAASLRSPWLGRTLRFLRWFG